LGYAGFFAAEVHNAPSAADEWTSFTMIAESFEARSSNKFSLLIGLQNYLIGRGKVCVSNIQIILDDCNYKDVVA
jgi:hypothetical protein